MSEQSRSPQPAPEQDPAEQSRDEAAHDEPAEVTRFVQVTRRSAPRFRAFVLTGLVVALLVAAVVAVLTPPADGYSQRALFGFLFCSLGLVGALLGGLAAVVADRRTGTRGPRRKRREAPGVRHSGRGPR